MLPSEVQRDMITLWDAVTGPSEAYNNLADQRPFLRECVNEHTVSLLFTEIQSSTLNLSENGDLNPPRLLSDLLELARWKNEDHAKETGEVEWVRKMLGTAGVERSTEMLRVILTDSKFIGKPPQAQLCFFGEFHQLTEEEMKEE